MWFTLADVLAAKMLTGRTPRILRALRFTAREVQPDLHSIDVIGRGEYRIDPAADDFYRRLIDLRTDVRTAQQEARDAGDDLANRLDAEQQALKITANATSYGIFVELNVETFD